VRAAAVSRCIHPLFVKPAGRLLTVLYTLLTLGTMGLAQVSPAEILNPKLKTAERIYLLQLEKLNQAIGATDFPFTFYLSRYVGLDPKQRVETDTRGIEFVTFHERVVLKITGNYDAAYNADRLTDNERASRTFRDVIIPILHLVIQTIPPSVSCDAIGLELSYHVRRKTKSYDYEGKELLVVVLDKPDVFGFFDLSRDSDRQNVLNRSEIYLDGNDFGLQLGQREAVNVEALGRPTSHSTIKADSPPASRISGSGARARLSILKQEEVTTRFPSPEAQNGAATRLVSKSSPGPNSAPDSKSNRPELRDFPVQALTQADADRLQAQCQLQLDTLAKTGTAQFHFVEYAPPSFAVFHNQIVLQVTLRNTLQFTNNGSIYKRAAQTFDLFLAPELKGILEKVPVGTSFEGMDIAVINNLPSKAAPASEAVEFICPLKPLRRFVEAEITNQDLINQSVVLVNGVRIALNLAQVE
jgi:hypothetical protein